MDVDPAFWSGKTVLVTGHTGFKGSWLTLWLRALGAWVVGYALEPPSEPALYERARVEDDIVSIRGDVRDAEAVHRAFSEHAPEVVIHLAAQSLVRKSYEDPRRTYDVNVMGTVNVLDAVRRFTSPRVVLVVTSDKCYVNDTKSARVESDPLGGRDPYSSSKAAAELVTEAYRGSFFSSGSSPAIASARAGNVIGGGDWGSDRLVPDVMRALKSGTGVAIRSPDAIRPWQHVLGPLSGYLQLVRLLWDSKALEGAWNFGPAPSDERRVADVVEQLARLWGEPLAVLDSSSSNPPEADYLSLDSTKAATLLDWRPTWGLDEALRRVVEWHRAYELGADARAVTLQQIAQFGSTAA